MQILFHTAKTFLKQILKQILKQMESAKKRSYSVVVSTPDFESGILGSSPSKTIMVNPVSSVGRAPAF
uniref:Uncharacterized protein n=1 Tax=viral metagenome TaxID=1070528 RepID=A0A6C0IM91_9ZZZZ